MVMLWNYLPYLVLLAFSFATWWLLCKQKFKWGFGIFAVGAFLFWLLMASVSYTPKGEPQRTQLEQFEAEELEMQDNLSKPDNASAARQERVEARKEYVEKVKP